VKRATPETLRARSVDSAISADAKRRRCADCHPVRLAGNGGTLGTATLCPWPRPCSGPYPKARAQVTA
jgi:hypothetical protein